MLEILAVSLLLSAGVERISFDLAPDIPTRPFTQDWYYFVDIGASWEPTSFFEVYGSVKTDFVPDPGSYMYHPFHNRYIIGAAFRFQNLEIIAEHMCGHPQQTYGYDSGAQYDEGRETIMIRGKW